MTKTRSSPPPALGIYSRIVHSRRGYSEGDLSSQYEEEGTVKRYKHGVLGEDKENERGYARNSDLKMGLRQFSIKVCKKVREKGITTYSEVADDLIADLGYKIERNEEKNIRRRVYDALNVFMAIGMIQREKKSIVWRGSQLSSSYHMGWLTQKEERMRRDIERKKLDLQELLDRCVVVQNLINRNSKRSDNPDGILHLPFLLVSTHRNTKVDCEIYEDRSHYSFVFDRPFHLYEDTAVLKFLYSSEQEPPLVSINLCLGTSKPENGDDASNSSMLGGKSTNLDL